MTHSLSRPRPAPSLFVQQQTVLAAWQEPTLQPSSVRGKRLRRQQQKGETHQYFSAFNNKKEASGSTQALLCRYSHPDLCSLKLQAIHATGLTRRMKPHRFVYAHTEINEKDSFKCENSAKRFYTHRKSKNKAEDICLTWVLRK